MPSPSRNLFEVVRHGRRWALKSEDRLLVVTRRRAEAEALAESAERVLTERRPSRRIHLVRPEPRSFVDDEDGS